MRRGFAVVVVVAVVAAGGAVAAVKLRSSSGGHQGAPTVTSTSAPAATVTSGVAPWTLRAPVDAEVVLVPPTSPTAGAPLSSSLEVFGGSTTGSRPASGIFTLDTTNGTLVHVANLTTVLSDAAGAVVNGQAVIFGGATPTSVATVQAFAGTGGARSPVPTATVTGSLPEPRAGAVAVTVGSTTYLVGGANGPTPDPSVLATTDARSFAAVATLPVPVSFPALAAVGTKLYVFGGQALSGAGAGQPVTTVQMVDLASHRTKVVGRLPAPLMGAAAFSLGGKVYVAGGDSSAGASAPATSVSSPASQTTGAQSSQTSGAIWAFNPAKVNFVSDGILQTPVARAGVAVLGSTVWFVGGASGGVPTSIVQTVTVAAAPSRSG